MDASPVGFPREGQPRGHVVCSPTFTSAPPRSLQRGIWVCQAVRCQHLGPPTGDILGAAPQQRQELGLRVSSPAPAPQGWPCFWGCALGLAQTSWLLHESMLAFCHVFSDDPRQPDQAAIKHPSGKGHQGSER